MTLCDVLKGLCECGDKRAVRMIPVFGVVREQSGQPVTKTPQYRKFPLFGGDLMAAITITATQEFTVTIATKDKKGNPAPVDGVPTWLTDSSDTLALTVAPDGLSATVSAVGILGTAKVQMTADAAPGEAVSTIIGTLDVTVVAGQATVVDLVPGVPTEQA